MWSVWREKRNCTSGGWNSECSLQAPRSFENGGVLSLVVVYARGLITRGQKGYAEDLAGAASVGTVSRFMAEEFSTAVG